jgi:hypothetical protein
MRVFRTGARRAGHWWLYVNRDNLLRQSGHITKIDQVLLALRLKELHQLHGIVPSLCDVGYRVFSQNDEDGILAAIFALVGTTNKTAVELCAGDGIECNTANLAVNHGWRTLLFDADASNVARGQAFYANHPDTYLDPPTFAEAWITTENVNTLVRFYGASGEVDLLSLDMDGVDYWIWDALTVISPRVVVLEFQSVWGATEAVTIPYRPDFSWDGQSDYYGASLPAMVTAARRKGYRLVGIARNAYNAFFLRDDVGAEVFPERPASAVLDVPVVRDRVTERLPAVRDRAWVTVSW